MEKLTPKAVIFDLGSTLIEYEVIPWDELNILCSASARESLISLGFQMPDEDLFIEIFDQVKSGFRKQASEHLIEWSIPEATHKLFEVLNVSNSDNLVATFFEAYYLRVKERLFVYDDTVKTLKQIKDKIGTIGLISNTIFPAEAHLGELERFELIDYFDFKIFSSSFKLRKPHKDIFLKGAELAGCDPTECVYVGDRYYEDIEGPNRVGMPGILKQKEGREYPDKMPLANRIIDNLSELKNHIDLE